MDEAPDTTIRSDASAVWSSSLGSGDPLPDAPGASLFGSRPTRALPAADREPRPFHSLAVGLIFGTGGIGVELATPINTKFNLRGSASFFGYNTSFVIDTIPVNGTLKLSNINASLDWFPRARSFHISPGITLYDHTRFAASIYVAGGQTVTFNDTTYISDPSDPIRGEADVLFGRTVAPRLTVGYGNVIRHNTPHFTFPMEVGVEYIKAPNAAFSIGGSSCTTPNDCTPIADDPETQQNIDEQQNEINAQIRRLRFFPIVSFGISYKFGH